MTARSLGLWALTCLLAALPQRALAKPAGATVERSLVDLAPTPGSKFSKINIDNRLGDVRVEGHDGDDLVILAVKSGPDRATVERLKVSLVPDPTGPVHVRTALVASAEAQRVAAGTVRIDLVVRVPRNAEVHAETWNGGIDASSLDNGVTAKANEGNIRVANVIGRVRSENAEGRQDLSQLVGMVEARALVGDVKLAYIRGKRLRATVHRGHIRGMGLSSEDISLRAMFGDVELEAGPIVFHKLQVVTHRGDIRIRAKRLPPRGLVLRAASKKGQVTLDESLGQTLDQASGQVVARHRAGASSAAVTLSSRLGNVVFSVVP